MANDINLPPLPHLQVPLIEADVSLIDIKVLTQWCERTATAYAHAAVLADRERDEALLRQALETLEETNNALYEGHPIRVNTREAIAALRERLSERDIKD